MNPLLPVYSLSFLECVAVTYDLIYFIVFGWSYVFLTGRIDPLFSPIPFLFEELTAAMELTGQHFGNFQSNIKIRVPLIFSLPLTDHIVLRHTYACLKIT